MGWNKTTLNTVFNKDYGILKNHFYLIRRYGEGLYVF